MSSETLMTLEGLKKHFPVRMGFWKKKLRWVRAVDGVSLSVARGEVLGIVGESGCGKSTLAQLILGIYPLTEGHIRFEGVDISSRSSTRGIGAKRMIQIVFQDPFWSLNPRKTVREIIAEPLKVHRLARSWEMDDRVADLLGMVGIDGARMFSYPHEFSGGERQRIAIARSLAPGPKLLVLDEPTSSIDTLSQAEILNLLIDIKNRMDLSYILISHDLSVVHFLSERIAVMYLGKVMEVGRTEEVFTLMHHPYTQALMEAVPAITGEGGIRPIKALEGNVPSAITPPRGCLFHTRCYKAQERCRTEPPALREITPGHSAACHYPNNAP